MLDPLGNIVFVKEQHQNHGEMLHVSTCHSAYPMDGEAVAEHPMKKLPWKR
jgi:hypothetical protein